MSQCEKSSVQNQLQLVLDLVQSRIEQTPHPYYHMLEKRVIIASDLVKNEREGEKASLNLKGALRAYLETNLPDRYDDPLIIELDQLEVLLDQYAKDGGS
ncbi:hypothetical protein P6709_09990 [Jeotgalibacillus sp. ET6]|uniref:hypothetical protein n=1 Tax=Jeotgalibacillus sp. ET6 TaxID=3037260 RepID=UPI00241870B8|nr:hypothetical protein [Jeotgalibacillus sp. ET6]MDG5472082.1 hypothetical protein [Jeotgalibacillus sp. ET6]